LDFVKQKCGSHKILRSRHPGRMFVLLYSEDFPGVAYDTGQCGGSDHHRTHQNRAARGGTLPTLEVAIRRTRANFVSAEAVGVHRKTHGTARIAPLKTGITENFVETELFRLLCD
jgi:hypothetical protein